MGRKRQAAQEVFYCVKTDARCINSKTGKMLAGYLRDELTAQQGAQFEHHLRHCIACSAAVINATNLQAALEAEEDPRIHA